METDMTIIALYVHIAIFLGVKIMDGACGKVNRLLGKSL